MKIQFDPNLEYQQEAIKDDEIERLYFVVETKSSLFTDALRPAEQAKIDCGMAHFDALGDDVQFIKATKMRDVEDIIYG